MIKMCIADISQYFLMRKGSKIGCKSSFMLKKCTSAIFSVSVCEIATLSSSTGWRPAPTRTVSYAGKLKHWSAPTSKSLNPFQ